MDRRTFLSLAGASFAALSLRAGEDAPPKDIVKAKSEALPTKHPTIDQPCLAELLLFTGYWPNPSTKSYYIADPRAICYTISGGRPYGVMGQKPVETRLRGRQVYKACPGDPDVGESFAKTHFVELPWLPPETNETKDRLLFSILDKCSERAGLHMPPPPVWGKTNILSKLTDADYYLYRFGFQNERQIIAHPEAMLELIRKWEFALRFLKDQGINSYAFPSKSCPKDVAYILPAPIAVGVYKRSNDGSGKFIMAVLNDYAVTKIKF